MENRSEMTVEDNGTLMEILVTGLDKLSLEIMKYDQFQYIVNCLNKENMGLFQIKVTELIYKNKTYLKTEKVLQSFISLIKPIFSSDN